MASKSQPSVTSSPASADQQAAASVGTPSAAVAPQAPGFDLYSFRESDDGKKLISWAKEQYSKCRTQHTLKHEVWVDNISFTLGHQWLRNAIGQGASAEFMKRLKPVPTPRHIRRRTINRIRSFVRTEQSKFLSTMPNINVVPATAEEEDIRAAYAGEQVVESYLVKRKLRREYSKAVWWMINTGNGILKDWWDPTIIDPTSGQPGDIVYRSVSPFNFFVPDMREQEIDDQPYVIQAQVKTVAWCRQFYGEELKGYDLVPDAVAAVGLMDDKFLNLAQTPATDLDATTILEIWVKPGTHEKLPKGGLLIMVGDCLVGAFTEGMPYKHNEYPFTKIEHMQNSTFWADSPIVDLKDLQREFNETRTQISTAAGKMGNPQLLAQKGSIVPGRLTNEPGQVIEYRPGTPPPQPIPLSPLPQYVTDQIQQQLTDFEDISGQHQITKAQAPAGVTSGTALSFLRETDDNFLTPQYQSVEDAFERISAHTLELFKQFVDQARKIKIIGLDGAYDTALLSGADVAGGSDVRVEPGSSIGESAAAKRATVMDLFSMGILTDPNQALRLIEIGGAQKILDTVSVAEKKAQRENMKMKALAGPGGEQALTDFTMQHAQQALAGMASDPNSPFAGQDMGAVLQDPNVGPQVMDAITQQIPPMIPADDFDVHAIHIDVHNRYRMGQEYETLPDPVKEQFDKHVQMHQMLMAQAQFSQMLSGMMDPSQMDPNAPVGDPTAGGPQPGPGPVDLGVPSDGAQPAPPAAPTAP